MPRDNNAKVSVTLANGKAVTVPVADLAAAFLFMPTTVPVVLRHCPDCDGGSDGRGERAARSQNCATCQGESFVVRVKPEDLAAALRQAPAPGTGAQSGLSASDRLESQVRKYMADNKVGYDKALAAVNRANPTLAQEYMDERRAVVAQRR